MAPDLGGIVAFLKATSFCEGLDDEAVAAIAGELVARPFRAGETLASYGDAATEFWVVAEGEIDGFLTDPRGRERFLGTVRRGETVGEVSILEGNARPIRFTARTPGVLLAAEAGVFRDWVAAYPTLMRNLFAVLTRRFREAIGVAARPIPAPRLAIIAPTPAGWVLTSRLIARLTTAGERIRVWADRPAALWETGLWPGSVPLAEMTPSGPQLREPAPPDLDRRVLVWTHPAGVIPDDPCLGDCDEILCLVEPKGALAGRLLDPGPGVPEPLADKLRVAWVLDSNTPVAPALPAGKWKKPPLKVRVEVAPSGPGAARLERQGVDRLARALRGYSLGIALAGGGAKGMAHLGALKVLDEAGVSFDVMSGTSAGALVGVLYASGMPPEEARERFKRDLTASWAYKLLPRWPNWYLLSQYRRRKWDAKLRRYLYDWRLEQLPIPFHAVAVDLVRVCPVVRSEGDAVHAILESINLPVVSPPILRDGMVLVDGGVLNNLPADVLGDRGVDFVVGVDVSRRVRHEFAGNGPDTPTARMRPAGTVDTLLRVFETQAHGIGSFRSRAVDFWITPDTSAFGLADFHRTDDIARAGEAAAREVVSQLQQRIAGLEKQLFGVRRT